jgi:hypothetical protein
MKKQFLTLLAALSLFAATQDTATAQSTVTRNVSGNFEAVTKIEAVRDSVTTFTYTDSKGNTEPVFQGAKGSFYVARTAKKSGNYYRKYLKTEESK